MSIYANFDYNEYQMNQILNGLETGLDVSVYADPKYSADEMESMREALECKQMEQNEADIENENYDEDYGADFGDDFGDL